MSIIDCDIHPALNGAQDVFPYLDEGWRQHFSAQEFKISGRAPERYTHPGVPLREDARPPSGGTWSAENLAAELARLGS